MDLWDFGVFHIFWSFILYILLFLFHFWFGRAHWILKAQRSLTHKHLYRKKPQNQQLLMSLSGHQLVTLLPNQLVKPWWSLDIQTDSILKGALLEFDVRCTFQSLASENPESQKKKVANVSPRVLNRRGVTWRCFIATSEDVFICRFMSQIIFALKIQDSYNKSPSSCSLG